MKVSPLSWGGPSPWPSAKQRWVLSRKVCSKSLTEQDDLGIIVILNIRNSISICLSSPASSYSPTVRHLTVPAAWLARSIAHQTLGWTISFAYKVQKSQNLVSIQTILVELSLIETFSIARTSTAWGVVASMLARKVVAAIWTCLPFHISFFLFYSLFLFLLLSRSLFCFQLWNSSNKRHE